VHSHVKSISMIADLFSLVIKISILLLLKFEFGSYEHLCISLCNGNFSDFCMQLSAINLPNISPQATRAIEKLLELSVIWVK
jgi:hypothetical protein